MKNRINTAKSRLFASHELYSVVKDQDYQVLAIDAEIDTFGVTIIKFAKGMCLSAGNTQYEVSILNTSLGRAAALDPLSGSGGS